MLNTLLHVPSGIQRYALLVEALLQQTVPQRADGLANADQSMDRVVSDCIKTGPRLATKTHFMCE